MLTTLILSALVLTKSPAEFHALAQSRADDLRISVYLTASHVEKLATDETARAASVDALKNVGATGVYIETYRSGIIVPNDHLIAVRDFLKSQGFRVSGGIATTPGRETGLRQEGGLDWFNWQNPKTQQDLTRIMETTAPLFDEYIVDDFFCTGDISAESTLAKGDRPWSDYRRELLSGLARTIFEEPAKRVNPDINLIIKFPQWYDLFHRFGYDIVNMPPHFDQIWVGTETRNAQTQRFGYTQPFEGFVNFRYFRSLHGDKVRGAWFDHIECNDHDFMDQVYQSTLAGAGEFIFFNYGDIAEGHPDHARLRDEFSIIADLARAVRINPVTGIAAYKPPNSEPHHDIYIMDFLGMLGIPIVPVTSFPEDANAIFLPAQAASDPNIVWNVREAQKRGVRLIITTGFLHAIAGKDTKDEIATLAGVRTPEALTLQKATKVAIPGGESSQPEHPVNVAAPLTITDATVLLSATLSDGSETPLLTSKTISQSQLFVLNTYMYTQDDYDRANEVLLSPQPIGLIELSQAHTKILREAFPGAHSLYNFDAPARVTLQPVGDSYIIQNYNAEPVSISFEIMSISSHIVRYIDRFTSQPVSTAPAAIPIPARGRLWLTADAP